MKILIFADEGKVLTDGESYGTPVVLADDRNPDEFTEITIEEYEKRMAEQEKEALENGFGT